MLFTEAKKFLNSKGYELEESLGLSVESVVNYIGKNYDFTLPMNMSSHDLHTQGASHQSFLHCVYT